MATTRMVPDHGPMMTIAEIHKMPTRIKRADARVADCHESCVRSYHVLARAKDWLRRGVPYEVILELIAELELSEVKP